MLTRRPSGGKRRDQGRDPWDHRDDEHGGLGDQSIDRDDFASSEIKPEEFEAAWSAYARASRFAI